jgi:hypothetical protein
MPAERLRVGVVEGAAIGVRAVETMTALRMALPPCRLLPAG